MHIWPAKRMVIWSDGDAVQTWWTVHGGTKQEASLDFAIAGATGVSDGASHTVPRLLLPAATSGRTLVDCTDVKLVAVESMNERACDHLRVGYAPGRDLDIWIATDTHLLVRLADAIDEGEGVVTSTLR